MKEEGARKFLSMESGGLLTSCIPDSVERVP